MKVIQKSGLPKRTRYTITDVTRLEREFEAVRSQGYALDREEAVAGACCIAAPVRNHKDEVAAAISISITAAHLVASEEPRLIAAVQEAAASISAALGYGVTATEPASKLRRRRLVPRRKALKALA